MVSLIYTVNGKKGTARFRLLTLSFSSVIKLSFVSLYKSNVQHEFAKQKAKITVHTV